jgi:peptidoglycan/LPS O-acetylase OafA/YrhL
MPEIDGLRFVAIGSVVTFHLYAQLVRYYGVQLSPLPKTLLQNGDRGVRLFFVISGFILALPFASHWLQGARSPDLKRYFLRRLTRLEPPYVINLLICGLLLVTVNHVAFASMLPHLASSLLYIHNVTYADLSTINPVVWSLEVEVQFYIVVPLLVLVFAIRRAWFRRLVMITGMLLAAWFQANWANTLRSHLSMAFYFQFFLAGFVIADLYLTRTSDKKSWWWDGVSVVGWPTIFLLEGSLVQIALPFVVIALYWAAFYGPLSNRLFRLPVITVVGGMCYTIYLFHFLVIAFATRLLGHNSPPLLLISVSLGLIVVVSSIYFLLIERPCMDRDWPTKLGTVLRELNSRLHAKESGSHLAFQVRACSDQEIQDRVNIDAGAAD